MALSSCVLNISKKGDFITSVGIVSIFGNPYDKEAFPVSHLNFSRSTLCLFSYYRTSPRKVWLHLLCAFPLYTAARSLYTFSSYG